MIIKRLHTKIIILYTIFSLNIRHCKLSYFIPRHCISFSAPSIYNVLLGVSIYENKNYLSIWHRILKYGMLTGAVLEINLCNRWEFIWARTRVFGKCRTHSKTPARFTAHVDYHQPCETEIKKWKLSPKGEITKLT